MTHHFVMKIPRKGDLQEIALDHSPDIEFKHFMKLYKNYTKEPFSLLVNYIILASDNSLKLRKNFL